MNKTIDIKNKFKFEELLPQEAPFRICVVDNTTDEVGEELKVHGKVMGEEIKHVRFYDPKTKTAYIRGNAPDALRLYIADKIKDKVVLMYVKEEEKDELAFNKATKKYEKTGNKEK